MDLETSTITLGMGIAQKLLSCEKGFIYYGMYLLVTYHHCLAHHYVLKYPASKYYQFLSNLKC